MATNDVADLLREAHELRWSVSIGSMDDAPVQMHETLLKVRAVQDRLEAIVTTLMGKAALLKQDLTDTTNDLEDAWNEQARSSHGFQFNDTAPRERYARYASETLNESIAKRRAEKAYGQVDVALQICKLYHRGIEGLRRDLDMRLRLYAWDTKLEH